MCDIWRGVDSCYTCEHMKHHELAQNFKNYFSLLKIASVNSNKKLFDSCTNEIQLYASKWYEILEEDGHIHDIYINKWMYITYIHHQNQ